MRSKLTARCYCGAVQLEIAAEPLTTTYCHCEDCRRASGAPVAAFAAFDADHVTVHGKLRRAPGPSIEAHRKFCPSCGSHVFAHYDYLPGQIYVSLGCIEQAADLPPAQHAHWDAALPWLQLDDDLPRSGASARDGLNAAGD